MKVAFVCDFLTKFGGAQRVLLAMHEIFPDAPIYALLYDEKGTKDNFKNCNIITSKLNKSIFHNKPKFLLPKFPSAIEEFDLSEYDLVISSNDSFCHGVITKPATLHLCYCHTPMRYAWDWHNEYLSENNIGFGLKGLIIRYLIHKIRIWDRVAADRVDFWIANSQNVKNRIKKYYLRGDAKVIYPPVDTEKIQFSNTTPQDYYVIISRLEPYKRVNLAVEACSKLNKKLVVIGEGTEMDNLKSIANDNITFLGWQSDESVFKHLSQAKAFIFAGEDDFGIAPVEAMAAGRPVIAFKKGGALESVIENKTGVFFDEPTSDSLSKAILNLEEKCDKLTPQNCRSQAEKFSKESFQKQIKEFAEELYKKHIEKINSI